MILYNTLITRNVKGSALRCLAANGAAVIWASEYRSAGASPKGNQAIIMAQGDYPAPQVGGYSCAERAPTAP